MRVVSVLGLVAASVLLAAILQGCGGNANTGDKPTPSPMPSPMPITTTTISTSTTTTTKPPGKWVKHVGVNCYPGRGGESVPGEPDSKSKTLYDCMASCKEPEGCRAVVVNQGTDEVTPGECYPRMLVYPDLCQQGSKYDLWVNSSAPTPPPTPVPTPSPPPPGFCADAGCCKAKAKYAEDGELCDDFYNTNTGIGFSMLSTPTWKGDCYGINGMDCAVFFAEPPTTVVKEQEAVSITHFRKGAAPYGGYNCAHGVAMRIGESSNYWRYFETCKGGGLAAQCRDGFKCNPRELNKGTFASFKSMKNEIVQQTGTSGCSLATSTTYNEFDTNGLSSSALAGVFRVPSMSNPADTPSLCQKMKNSNPKRTNPWPVYAYQYRGGSSSLTLESYLDCGVGLMNQTYLV